MKVYDVQTVYGTREKTFINSIHAIDYYKQLSRDYDPDLIEFNTLHISENDFIYMDFDD